MLIVSEGHVAEGDAHMIFEHMSIHIEITESQKT